MNVLVIHPTPRPFIDTDVEMLRSAFAVRTVHVRFHPRRCFVADTLAAIHHTIWADVVLAWFGGLHALFPFVVARLVNTRCAVIASGVDVAAQPSIGYGHMRPGWLRTVGRLVFWLAHRLLAVSAFTAQEAARNAHVPPANIDIIPHGIPPCPPPPSHDRRGVITVATANARTLQVKGLFTFVRAAARLPDTPFELIGGGDAAALRVLRRHASPNVTFTAWLPPEDLQARMAHAAVYVQLSAYESFGMALAEAMRCGCVPVVTRRGALPEVAGDTGWYVPYDDPDAAAQAVRHALDAPATASAAARERIATHFPLSRRRDALVQAVRTLRR